jgi:hypothetical protein
MSVQAKPPLPAGPRPVPPDLADETRRILLRCSPSLLCNNLSMSASGESVVYAHLNEAWVARGLSEPQADCRQVAYKEQDHVAQVQFVKLDIGEVIVLLSAGGALQVSDSQGQKIAHAERLGAARLRGIASDGARHLYIGTSSGTILVFEVGVYNMTQVCELSEHAAAISDLCCAAGGPLVSADERGNLVAWEIASSKGRNPKRAAALQGKPGAVATSVAASAAWICAGFSSGHVHVYAAKSLKLFAEIAAHSRSVTALAMHPEQPCTLASVGEDTALNLWTLPSNSAGKVAVRLSKIVKSALLVGVRLVGAQAFMSVFDSKDLRVLPLP